MGETAHRRDAHARNGSDESIGRLRSGERIIGLMDVSALARALRTELAASPFRPFAVSPFRLAPEPLFHLSDLRLQLFDSLIKPGQSLDIHLSVQELS
jgi:hypothetical protein